ncbi:MAG: 4Fe-4S dicluster domain-containing protein [Rhodospirillaceae bacterium]|nr:4Fe-4S dicluster domain-containing protein [Rhodospirillaceae bacterium]
MSRETSIIAELFATVAGGGLLPRGYFHPEPEDGVPPMAGGEPAGTLLLLGHVGRSMWPAFSASPEAADGAPDPLDRWSRRLIDALARRFGGMALYPFGGPPYLPFQRWARRAEPVAPSPLGIFIHPEYGLWHGYRGALALAPRWPLAPVDPRPSPCLSCVGQPCLQICPVDAFTAAGYAVEDCRAHLDRDAGTPCRDGGCLARRVCPVGPDYVYDAAQIRFHMRAFHRAGRNAATIVDKN